MMEHNDLIRALRRRSIDSLTCLGCGFEHNCSVHGCQIITKAAVYLELMQSAIYQIEERQVSAKGTERAIYGEILAMLGGTP